MKLENVLRYAAIGMASVGLGLGLAAAQSASIDETGPDSTNKISFDLENALDIDNNNDVDVKNDVDQDATSGDAKAERNTNAGDAESGAASNDSSLDSSVSLNNNGVDWSDWFGGGGDFDASIDTTGPDSYNKIEFDSKNTVNINNHNDVYVKNDVDQDATSGDATVRRNTNGGSATSGDASNSSSVSTSVEINN